MKKYTIIYMISHNITAVRHIECLEGLLLDHLETIGIDGSQLWAVIEGHPKTIDTDWSKL